MRSTSPHPDHLSATDQGPLAGYRVLVVDDEEDVRDLLLTVLADAGAQIAEAGTATEAIEVARRIRPDLITLDLSMPGSDGVDAFLHLRAEPEIGAVPICVITGRPELRRVIYDRPAAPPEGYLDKPVAPDEVVSTVRRILGLRERRARRARQ
jgi:CheY-like chemotaxis protein